MNSPKLYTINSCVGLLSYRLNGCLLIVHIPIQPFNTFFDAINLSNILLKLFAISMIVVVLKTSFVNG